MSGRGALRAVASVAWWGVKIALFLGGAVFVMLLALWLTVDSQFKDSAAVVPEVRGMELDEAREAVTDAGLVLEVEARIPHETLEPGRVAFQDPGPGTSTRRSRAVRVKVSSGTRSVATPDVVGRSKREAALALRAASLDIGETLQVHSNATANTVLAQSPRPGDLVGEEGRVDVLLSLGPGRRAMVMPDLRGHGVSEAERLLAEAGLRIGDVQQAHSAEGREAGTVQAQSPPPGSRIFRDTPVMVSVASRSASPAPAQGAAAPELE
jgi:serine/threonine-protein kinase